jgi:RNA polymerase sigma factor (sigma-70 family)
MMSFNSMAVLSKPADAELVLQCRSGDQQAFGQIVSRYQTLVASLAYNAMGSISRSEDLAQETFVTAWRQLHTLREPERLRSWLCGIARNLIANANRAQSREPTHQSDSLEKVRDAASHDVLPSEDTIRREEEEILWRSLESIPSLYREPLILYYREQQSVEHVAAALGISTDAVKQRLARGRRMLDESVTAFVEGALRRSVPGKLFTAGVVAALPAVTASSATAATLGTAGAKVAMAAKAGATASLLAALWGPFMGVAGGALGSWMSIKNTRSLRERQLMIRQTWITWIYVLSFVGLLVGGAALSGASFRRNPVTFGCIVGGLAIAYSVGLLLLILRGNRRQREIQIEDGTFGFVPQPRIPTRRQELWTVFGSLGGGTVGSLAWIVVQGIQMKQWVTSVIAVLFGVALVLVGGFTWLRDPNRRVPVLLTTVGLLGVFIVVVGALHWGDWTKARGVEATAVQAVIFGVVMTAVAGGIGAYRAVRRWMRR